MTLDPRQRASKAIRKAEQDLVRADLEAEASELWRQKQARTLRRAAKRRRAKADRRLGKDLCDPDRLEG